MFFVFFYFFGFDAF